jgi:hypothetical protein
VEYASIAYKCMTAGSLGNTPGISFDWRAIPSWNPHIPYRDFSGNAIGPRGPLRSVSGLNPHLWPASSNYELLEDVDGTTVIGLKESHPWARWRRPTPILTGDDFSATTTYEATDPADLVYDT